MFVCVPPYIVHYYSLVFLLFFFKIVSSMSTIVYYLLVYIIYSFVIIPYTISTFIDSTHSIHLGGCAAFVAVGYDLCPTVKFHELVHQVKCAVAHILTMFPGHTMHVIGHSAGAHLGAEVLITDWQQEFGLTVEPQTSKNQASNTSTNGFIGSYCLVSGVYDLRPIYRSYVNDACRMSEKEAVIFSPALTPRNKLSERVPAVPVLIAVGQYDSPCFREQSYEFYTLLKETTKATVSFLEMPGEDHFTSIERLEEDKYVLSQQILEICLGRGGD